MDTILADILETLYKVLGFNYATISLVDLDRQVIESRGGIWKGKLDRFPEWLRLASYPLEHTDIQAEIIRKKEPIVLNGWDPRLNKEIWDKFHHEKLVRVFMPIKWVNEVLGTIEAGDYKTVRECIDDEDVNILAEFASQVALVIHVAQYLEKLKVEKEKELGREILSIMQGIFQLFAHEIRNAKGAITCNVTMLQECLSNPKSEIKIDDCLDSLNKTAQYLVRFSNSLNTPVSVGAILPYDVNVIIQDTVKQAPIPSVINMILSIPEHPTFVMCDRLILQTVFKNLIKNACEAMMDKGGLIRISIDENVHDRFTIVRVCDSGPGIPIQIQSRLFRDRVTTKFGNAGVALCASSAALKLMGGDINLESTSSAGTVFNVKLRMYL